MDRESDDAVFETTAWGITEAEIAASERDEETEEEGA